MCFFFFFFLRFFTSFSIFPPFTCCHTLHDPFCSKIPSIIECEKDVPGLVYSVFKCASLDSQKILFTKSFALSFSIITSTITTTTIAPLQVLGLLLCPKELFQFKHYFYHSPAGFQRQNPIGHIHRFFKKIYLQ